MEIFEFIKQIEQQRKEQDAIYHNVAVKYHLSDSAMWVLYVVSETEGCTQQYICNEGYFPKQTINTAVAKLADEGYVELQMIAGSRNQKKIVLTEQGWILVRNTTECLKEAERCAYGKLREEELYKYLEITAKLTQYLREETDKL